MKKVLVPFILIAIALTVFMLIPHNTEAKSSKTSFVASISCESCKNKIEKKMKDVDGVNSTNVDVDTKTVSFDYNPEVITVAELKTKVSKLGYEVSDISAKDCATDKECSTDKANGKKCSNENKKVSSTKECGTDKCCKDKAFIRE